MSEQTRTLSLTAAYEFGAAHGLEREVNEIRDMVIEWDSSYTSSLRRGFVVSLFETRGVFEDFKRAHWAVGDTPAGETQRRRYLRIKDDYEAFLRGEIPPVEDPEEAVQFALEAHLRDFLARNLDRIEPGLRLYESKDRNGVEFPVDGGRIDLLAVDGRGRYLVIELKVSQGRNKTLGQLLYYMSWVDKNLGKSQCRGLIIASEIGEELAMSVARVPDVALAKYRMSFSIEPVANGSGAKARA